MRDLRKTISTVLANENGGPNVEQIMGIAVALAVGAGLFLFGSKVYDWFNGEAGDTVSGINVPDSKKFQLHAD